jgi:hypothetical protein
MRTIQTLTLTACCLLISFYSYSQNLQFNSAVYYEYGGGISDGDVIVEIVTTGTLVVLPNQVLKITNSAGSTEGIYLTGILINEKALGGGDIYLPAGEYTVGIPDSYVVGEVRGYISGVLYDIVP